MKELGSCVPPISGEHVISNAVCSVLTGEGKFSISGVPWLEEGQSRIIAPPQAKCLCTKHNSTLSCLDDAAKYFFASLRSYLEHDAGMRHAIVSGHDLERWLLKTAKAAAVARYLARGRERLSGAFARDSVILDMLDDPRHWPKGAGLYCVMNEGDRTGNTVRFQFQPFTNEHDEIEAFGFNIMGFRFVLLLGTADETKYAWLNGARYRPGRLVILRPKSTCWLTMSWDDDRSHEELTVQWLRKA
jgi:hypothetical protein